MTRMRVVLVSLAFIMAFGALVWMVIVFTPLRHFVPGTLRGDLRAQYLETALRLDSLEEAARANEAYLSSVLAIMRGEADTIPSTFEPAGIPVADSLAKASDAERRFVSRYLEEERFNLSVLAPIAAEGMIFATPVPSTATVNTGGDGTVTVSAPGVLPASAVYRGTVTSVAFDADGRTVVTVQHPNDFVSVYSGLSAVFVAKGAKVAAGQRIGHVSPPAVLTFELWHNGALLPPHEYIAL